MNASLINTRLIKYEFRNLIGNIFTMIFGVLFPIFMTIFLGKVMSKQMPESGRDAFTTTIFITSSLIIPLASILIGFSAIFSQELEKNVPLRFRLFGYSEKTILVSKICANTIFITLSFALYSLVVCPVLKVQTPTLSSLLIFIISLYLLSAFLFVFSYGMALYFKKFGPTFGTSMILYFGVMILSGMFGIQAKNFPSALKAVAYCLPTTYMSSDFVDFWTGGSYNFVPFIQSFTFFAALSSIVLFLSIQHNSRRVK